MDGQSGMSPEEYDRIGGQLQAALKKGCPLVLWSVHTAMQRHIYGLYGDARKWPPSMDPSFDPLSVFVIFLYADVNDKSLVSFREFTVEQVVSLGVEAVAKFVSHAVACSLAHAILKWRPAEEDSAPEDDGDLGEVVREWLESQGRGE